MGIKGTHNIRLVSKKEADKEISVVDENAEYHKVYKRINPNLSPVTPMINEDWLEELWRRGTDKHMKPDRINSYGHAKVIYEEKFAPLGNLPMSKALWDDIQKVENNPSLDSNRSIIEVFRKHMKDNRELNNAINFYLKNIGLLAYGETGLLGKDYTTNDSSFLAGISYDKDDSGKLDFYIRLDLKQKESDDNTSVTYNIIKVSFKKFKNSYLPKRAWVESIEDASRGDRIYRMKDKAKTWVKKNQGLKKEITGDFITEYDTKDKPNNWDRLPDWRLRRELNKMTEDVLQKDGLLPKFASDISFEDNLYGHTFKWKKNPFGNWAGVWDFEVLEKYHKSTLKNSILRGRAKLNLDKNGQVIVKYVFEE